MKAINYHIKGIITTFQELAKGKYLAYFIPGAVVMLIFLYIRYSVGAIDDAVNLKSDYSWWDYVLSWVNWLVHGLFSGIDFISEQIYIFIVITALSPFNTHLGEKMDHDLTGHKVTGGFARFINDIIRMIFVVIIMIVMEMLFYGAYWTLTWLPFIGGFYDDFIYQLIAAFFFGLSIYDFALERDKKGVFATLGFAFKNPLGMIITGGIFLGLYNIPYIGIPISMVISVMISTVAYAYYSKSLPKQEEQKDLITNE